jgi:hypothetical protein
MGDGGAAELIEGGGEWHGGVAAAVRLVSADMRPGKERRGAVEGRQSAQRALVREGERGQKRGARWRPSAFYRRHGGEWGTARGRCHVMVEGGGGARGRHGGWAAGSGWQRPGRGTRGRCARERRTTGVETRERRR